MVWSCFPFIWSGQNHLARHSERGKKTKRTKEEVGRQHQGMDRPGVRQVPEGSGEHGKMEKSGCKIICGAPTTLAVKGLMMIMIMILLRTQSLVLCSQARDAEEFPLALGLERLDLLLRGNKQGQCRKAIEEGGEDKRLTCTDAFKEDGLCCFPRSCLTSPSLPFLRRS